MSKFINGLRSLDAYVEINTIIYKQKLCDKVAGLGCVIFEYRAKHENMLCCCIQLYPH